MAKLKTRDLDHLAEVEAHELADIKGGGSTIPVPDYTFLTRSLYTYSNPYSFNWTRPYSFATPIEIPRLV